MTLRGESAQMLQGAGLRATAQRVAILDLLRTRSRPVAAEELTKASRGAFDLATTYRTLESLKAKRLIRAVAVGQARTLYEMADDHHHHAICVSCGRIRDISTCVSPRLDETVRKAVNFNRIDSHALEFFGVCQSCATRGARKK